MYHEIIMLSNKSVSNLYREWVFESLFTLCNCLERNVLAAKLKPESYYANQIYSNCKLVLGLIYKMRFVL